VFMACILLGQKLGIACYNAGTQQLVTTETWEESASGEFPTIQLLKFQEQPTVIIASTKADKAFLNALTTPVEEGGSIFFVKTVKSNLFSYEHAQNRLTFLQWSGMPQGLNATQRLQLLNTKIRLEDDVQVRALGALLTVLQQEMILDNVEVTDNDGDSTSLGVRIGSISQLNLDGFLSVDAWTLNSLQIFQSDKHPSPMGIGKTKEGFSVFGLLNKCVTAGGRSMLRMWFLRPIVDLQVIQDRHQTISFLSSFPELLTSLHSFLQHVKDIPKLLMKLKSATTIVTRKDWLQLLESVSYLLEVREVFEVTVAQWQAEKSSNSAFPLIPKVFEAFSDHLTYIRDLISGVIEFDQVCGTSQETMVAYGICQELDELKQLYEGLPDFLTEVVQEELKKMPSGLAEASESPSIVYMPQVGYLMRFEGPPFSDEAMEGLLDYRFAFEGDNGDGAASFYHTDKTRELDQVLGDVFHKILDMESVIIRDLEGRVLEHSDALTVAFAVAAEIDCLVSLALSAREFNLKQPRLTKENVLKITNGRHLLQELVVDTFVPNNTSINQDSGRIVVITGPNFSGKSIYVKQVCIPSCSRYFLKKAFSRWFFCRLLSLFFWPMWEVLYLLKAQSLVSRT
ncbi:unnamed protein product, partial [Closterium sp. Naga37s-1]